MEVLRWCRGGAAQSQKGEDQFPAGPRALLRWFQSGRPADNRSPLEPADNRSPHRRVNLSSANSIQILADSLLDFVKDTADMPTNSDESKLPSTLVSNLSINENGYIWKGNLPQLKRFVQNDLKLIGKWSSPGGETKLFKNTEISLKWFGSNTEEAYYRKRYRSESGYEQTQ